MATVKFTRQQVAARNHRNDAAIIIDNIVYDVTEFMNDHPGSGQLLLAVAGTDASEYFLEAGHSDFALDWRQEFVVGEVVDEDRWEVLTPADDVGDVLRLGAVLSVCGPIGLAGLATLIFTFLYPI